MIIGFFPDPSLLGLQLYQCHLPPLKLSSPLRFGGLEEIPEQIWKRTFCCTRRHFCTNGTCNPMGLQKLKSFTSSLPYMENARRRRRKGKESSCMTDRFGYLIRWNYLTGISNHSTLWKGAKIVYPSCSCPFPPLWQIFQSCLLGKFKSFCATHPPLLSDQD